MAVRPRGCDLVQDYRTVGGKKGVAFQKHTSSSEAVIFFGHSVQVAREVAGKIFTSHRQEYEARIYELMVPLMLRRAPFFLPWVFTARCDERTRRMIPFEKLVHLGPDKDMVQIIGTIRYPQTKPLEEWLHESHNAFELLQIFFQIVAAIYVLEEQRGMHNDLYVRNVLVQDLGTPTEFAFDIGGTQRTLVTRYKAMLFDWDRSYFDALGPNAQLTEEAEWCDDWSMCNYFKAGKDLLTISCDMYEFFGHSVFDVLFASYPAFVQQVHLVDTFDRCLIPANAPINYSHADTFNVLNILVTLDVLKMTQGTGQTATPITTLVPRPNKPLTA